MNFNFPELRRVSMMIAEIDGALQKALQMYGDEYHRMKDEVNQLREENVLLKKQLEESSK